MTQIRIVLCVLAAIFILPAAAYAACASPAGAEGDLVYNQGWKIVQYCDGTNWQAAMKAGAGNTGDCTAPVRSEGTIIYNQDDNVPQVCIGGWRALGPINTGAGTGGCSTPTKDEGTIIYNDDDDVMQYCDGSQYVQLLGPAPENCPNIGDTCIDGSVYAGISPDGSEAMYVTRCDGGMSYDGTTCQGTRSTLSWNNGNTSDRTSWGGSSDIDGDGNTEFLITFDADGGTAGVQPHQAPQACADLVLHGRDDWYLPAKDELEVIYEQLVDATPDDDSPDALIDGFDTSGTYYWSSSEYASVSAWRQRFSDGVQTSYGKIHALAVRCARR